MLSGRGWTGDHRFLGSCHNSRHPDREDRAAVGLAPDRDVTAHHLTEPAADREAKARAAVFARRCGRNLGKTPGTACPSAPGDEPAVFNVGSVRTVRKH
jgi:hypothetical protein